MLDKLGSQDHNKQQRTQWRHGVTMGLCALSLLLSSAMVKAERLNVRDADIREVVETVARITGKTMIVDPRVKGLKVTIISNNDFSKEEIYNQFVSTLQIHGFQAIENNGVIKIVQDQKARYEASPVNVKNPQSYGDRAITQVIPVQNVDAQQIMNVLRPLVSPQSGHLFAVQGTNTLILHDSASNVERITQIIERTDKANDEEIEVIPLQHASASEIVRILESLDRAGQQERVNQVKAPRYVADERTNSILLSAGQRQRVRLRALIHSLDRQLDSTGNTKTVFLKYAKAEQVADVLQGVGEIKKKEEAANAGRAGAGAASGTAAKKALYSVQFHEETNSLVLTAPPDIMREFESIIRSLDIRRKQVHVEAIIVEISDTKAKELGIQWLFSPSGSGTQPAGIINFDNTGTSIGQVAGGAIAARGQEEEVFTRDPETGAITGTETITTGGDNGAALAEVLGGLQGAGLGIARMSQTGVSWAAFIKALEGVTDSNTLARPSITTLDNVEAIFKAGQEIPIITGSTLGSGNTNPFQSVDRKDVGVMLKITPQINEGNYVRLDIEQEVSSLAGTTAVDVVTNKREVKTSVLVPDGGMVVLGGLIDDDIQESSQKVPLLGDIPIIGHAFKSQRTQKIKRNLMVFIHPRVLKDDKDLREISNAKYSYMRAQQIEQANRGISLMPSAESPIMPTYDEALVLPPSFEEYLDNEKLLENGEENTESTSEEGED
ncbi:type II secretion system secretin GspD [Kangiella sediminilitoris]|uniref:General secretion pathway protein D n=1 Tax=Kangiella sediminilitoris TaxID=1144748 RepID=A0A1B3B888_9GAMM|nr:type II secretion system secretin GspD [Kangiella sediminilitoris]AOE49019.1 General secretion pathway protein D [Kangiella sediminilitoris]